MTQAPVTGRLGSGPLQPLGEGCSKEKVGGATKVIEVDDDTSLLGQSSHSNILLKVISTFKDCLDSPLPNIPTLSSFPLARSPVPNQTKERAKQYLHSHHPTSLYKL